MKSFIQKLLHSEKIRYLFFGGCTTLVSLGSFAILRYTANLQLQVANILSILLAIIFAYITNKLFVFDANGKSCKETILEFVQFTGMRAGTMAIEIAGLWFLTDPLRAPEFFSKLIIQVVIIISNYFISKFIVFQKKEASQNG